MTVERPQDRQVARQRRRPDARSSSGSAPTRCAGGCCREVPRVGEADFTEDRLVETANRDLANGVGNLVQRIVALAARRRRRRRARPRRDLVTSRSQVDDAIARFDLRGRDRCDRAEVDAVNRYVEATQPWSSSTTTRAARCAARARRPRGRSSTSSRRSCPTSRRTRRADWRWTGARRTAAVSRERQLARACSARRRAMTRRHSVSSAPSKIESTRASTK